MSVTFPAATREDLPRVRSWMKDFYAAEGLTPSPGAPHALAALLADSSLGACSLIVENGQQVGYLVIGFSFSLEFGGRDAFIDELYIVPGARRRGIGRRAVEFALQFCRRQGTRALHLEVARKNEGGQHLYRSLGFRERHLEYDLLTRRIDA